MVWRCRRYQNDKCLARIKTRGGVVVERASVSHNHDANQVRAKADEVRGRMRQMAVAGARASNILKSSDAGEKDAALDVSGDGMQLLMTPAEEDTHYLACRYYAAMAFVPAPDVVCAWEELLTAGVFQSKNADLMEAYIEKQFVGSLRVNLRTQTVS